MSDDAPPSSGSENENKPTDAESGVMRFLQSAQSKKQLLSSPEPDELVTANMKARSEWASTFLSHPGCQWAIQQMNERVMQEIYGAQSSDATLLGELSVRLKVITEFVDELHAFLNAWEEIEVQREQQAARDREERIAGPNYDPYDKPPQDIVI